MYPLYSQEPETLETDDGDDGDEEARFWAVYKAQQQEAEAKAALKEKNFAKEWSTPSFVHLR